MARWDILAGVTAALLSGAASAEPMIWGIQIDQLEYRLGESDFLSWEGEALVGSDELKLFLGSEADFSTEEDAFETLESQLRIQTPISDFFDITGGVRIDTPEGPDRVYGMIGVRGLAPQWLEIEADLFVSDEALARVEVEYEALITNYLILTPTIEIDLPLTDDREIGLGAWGPKVEAGARLSYDLIDRAVAPYAGIHYERAFGETAGLARARGENDDSLLFVAGVRLMY